MAIPHLGLKKNSRLLSYYAKSQILLEPEEKLLSKSAILLWGMLIFSSHNLWHMHIAKRCAEFKKIKRDLV
jgi:hypothetical protein